MGSTYFDSAIDPKLLVAGNNEDRAGTLGNLLLLQDSGSSFTGTFAPHASGHEKGLLEGSTKASSTSGPIELTDEEFACLLTAAIGGAGHTPLDIMGLESSAELNAIFGGYEFDAPTSPGDPAALEHPAPAALAPAHMIDAQETDPTRQNIMDFVDYAACDPPSPQIITHSDDYTGAKTRQDLAPEAAIQYVNVTEIGLGSIVGVSQPSSSDERQNEGREVISFSNCVKYPCKAHYRKDWKYWEKNGDFITSTMTPPAPPSTSSSAKRPKAGKGSRGPYKKQRIDGSDGILASHPQGRAEESGVKKRHGGGRAKGNTNCGICGRVFARPGCLKVHMDTIHGEGVICECGSKFSGKSSHRRHRVSGVCKGPEEQRRGDPCARRKVTIPSSTPVSLRHGAH